jgi:hypothetical protein
MARFSMKIFLALAVLSMAVMAHAGQITSAPTASVSNVVQGSCADACKKAGYQGALQSGSFNTGQRLAALPLLLQRQR